MPSLWKNLKESEVKAKNILVDTSVWIASFKKDGDLQLKQFLKNTITTDMAVTCPIIILELVQGCKTPKEKDTLLRRFESLENLSITSQLWNKAYDIAFLLRRKGLTIPTVDLIIASVAIENDCILFHKDVHFELIANNYSELQTKFIDSIN